MLMISNVDVDVGKLKLLALAINNQTLSNLDAVSSDLYLSTNLQAILVEWFVAQLYARN